MIQQIAPETPTTMSMAAQHWQVDRGNNEVPPPGSPALSVVMRLCSLMRRHLWHASILTTLTLLQTLVVECLLLLLLCHVATMLRRTRHTGLCGRHCGDVLWGVRNITRINPIFVASRLGRVQTGLNAYCKQNGRRCDRRSGLLG
jgi:hypothetical protein